MFQITEILDNFLYISGFDGLKLIDARNIGAVVNCVKGAKNGKLSRRFKKQHAYLHIAIEDDDSQSIASYFDQVFDFLDKMKLMQKRVLVYCGLGVSRSSSFVIGEFTMSF